MKKNYILIMIQENEQQNKCLFVVYNWQEQRGLNYFGLPVIRNLPQATTTKQGGLVFDYFEAVELLEQDGDTREEIQQKLLKASNSSTFVTVGKTKYHTAKDSQRLLKRLKKVEQPDQVVIDWATFHDSTERV